VSGWDPHRDLARLLAALGQELVVSGQSEVQAACFHDGDSVDAAAKDVRKLIGTLIDDPDDPETGVRPLGTADGPAHWARQH
jgi:hypothetical protein